MKRVAFWRWMTWDMTGTKMTPTGHHMTEADALARHPEAVRVEGSMIERDLPETPEELANVSPGHQPSRVK